MSTEEKGTTKSSSQKTEKTTPSSSFQLKNHVVISLVGKQGSGKTSIGNKLGELLGVEHVETSDIVRRVTGVNKRGDLPATGRKTKDDPDWLGKAVAEVVERGAKQHKPVLVLTGVREIEVHNYLFKCGADLYAFEVTADPEVRYQRLKLMGKVNSSIEFLDQELQERELGVDRVEAAAPFQIPTSKGTSASRLAKAVARILDKRGVKIWI